MVADAVVALDVEVPGGPMRVDDIVARLAADGTPRAEVTVVQWLGRESRHPHGAVVRVANRTYVRRRRLGAGSLSPRERVMEAVLGLRAAGARQFSVQDLLAAVNAGGAPLSQRSVYFAVADLLRDDVLLRAAWGQYR